MRDCDQLVTVAWYDNRMRHSRTLASLVAGLLMVSPAFTYAFPFGGMAGLVHFCFNQAIYTVLGPPIGGPYIWTPATKTYQFGPPTHAGQWLLGLSGVPYYCLYTIAPLEVRPGISIMMGGEESSSYVA